MKFSLSKLVVLALGATQAAAAGNSSGPGGRDRGQENHGGYKHGELDDFGGRPVRWHQLAEGVFTGVNPDEWDDKIHKRGTHQWDENEIMEMQSPKGRDLDDVSLQVRDLELEARNLEGACQLVYACTRVAGQWVLLKGSNLWVKLSNYYMHGSPYTDLMGFLNQPFVANAGGVAIAGVVSGQINEATKKECSTNKEDPTADIIASALAAAIAKKPDAEQVKVEVNGPSGSWSVTVSAGPPNTKPAAVCTPN